MTQLTSHKETFWSRFASDFEQRNNYVAGLKEINSLKKLLSENKNLGKTLELGCGDGAYTNTLLANSEKIVATDWSAEMTEASRLRFKDNTDIEVKQENCLNLSFENNSFASPFFSKSFAVLELDIIILQKSKRPKGK